jgi:hypothetical protein
MHIACTLDLDSKLFVVVMVQSAGFENQGFGPSSEIHISAPASFFVANFKRHVFTLRLYILPGKWLGTMWRSPDHTGTPHETKRTAAGVDQPALPLAADEQGHARSFNIDARNRRVGVCCGWSLGPGHKGFRQRLLL